MSETAPRGVVVLDRVITVADRALRLILTVAFGVILVVTLAQIAGRNGFLPAVTGADEIGRYLMVATTFLAIPVLITGRLQIAVDALAHYLPGGVPQVWLHRIILLVEAAFYAMFANYAALVWTGYRQTGQSSAELSIPLSWPTLTIVVGAALGAVLTAALLVRTFMVPDQYRTQEVSGFLAVEGADR